METKQEITMDREEACKKLSKNKMTIYQLIDDCVKVSKASGVPFSIHVASVHNEYVPASAVQVEETEDTEGGYLDENGDPVSGYDGSYPGHWQSSMC